MATKTLFIKINRSATNRPDWGFTVAQIGHRRLDSVLVVENVVPDSPAYEADLRPGDIILGVDNSPITGRPLTYSLAIDLIQRATNSIELQVLRDPKSRVRKLKSYSIMNTTFPVDAPRPFPVNRGVIPSVAQMDSGIRLPDNNVAQYMNEKAREQWAITKQTYRSTPLIEPKPKVRRDWPMGSYLKYMEGPGWHDPPKHLMVQDPSKLKVLNQLGDTGAGGGGQPVFHRQYNSPINLYSESNLNNTLNPGSPAPGSGPPGPAISPNPIYKVNAPKQETVDITHSPTYQFLQEERAVQRSHSPFNRNSPEPQQTPYLKTLMHSLNVSNF